MKTKKVFGDGFFYVCFCITTFGAVWVARLIVSQGIRMALKDDVQ